MSFATSCLLPIVAINITNSHNKFQLIKKKTQLVNRPTNTWIIWNCHPIMQYNMMQSRFCTWPYAKMELLKSAKQFSTIGSPTISKTACYTNPTDYNWVLNMTRSPCPPKSIHHCRFLHLVIGSPRIFGKGHHPIQWPTKKKKKKPSKEQMHVVVAPSFQLSLTNNNFVIVACSNSSRPSPTLK